MAKIVDGIKISEVKAGDLNKMVKAFNDAKLGTQIKAGANPLGTAKAFVKAVESLDDDKQAVMPDAVADYYNLIVVSEEELAAQQKPEEEEEEPTKPTQKKGGKVVPIKKTEKKPKGTRTVAEQHGTGKKVSFGRDPNKPTKKSIVISMVSKSKGASLDEMGKAMTEAGLGDFERNKTTAKLWIPKLGFKVAFNEKTGRYSKE